MKFRKILSAILCVFVLVSAMCVNTVNAQILNPIDTTDGEVVAKFYDSLLNYVIKNYRYEITREELLTAAVKQILTDHPELLEEFGKGMFEILDENSFYYNEEEYNARFEDVSGIYVGIGINVYYDEVKVILGEPIGGSPAEESGLKIGDVIVAVDGERVENYGLDKVTSLIKGEVGTTVDITVLRNGKEYTYTLKRAVIKINPISYEIIDDKTAYVKISSFNASTIDVFTSVMNELGEKGIKTIILDLRNNLGGYADAAIAVASYFIPDGGLIFTEEYKNEAKNIEHKAKETKYKFKGVILINEYSASASEVVTGSIKDHGTGIVVGQTSYGKGTVQHPIALRSNHYMWYTVAEYYTPSHNTIHKVGIKPDYSVVNKYADFDMSTVTPYEITRVLRVGDTGDDVYAVKERLKKLGYIIELNDVYDENTANAISSFQRNTELFSYGVADITTQIKINDVLKTSKVEADKQLEKAKKLAENMK